MAVIEITVTPPGGSPFSIVDDCVFEKCSFSQNMNAVAGRFSVLVRDPNRTHSFTTGSEIVLTVDGIDLFGGYVTSIDMGHFAPAADTSNLSTYMLRTWTLQGPDYNIIFDKRVWRNTADYLKAIELDSFTTDGAILREAVDNYADLSDFSSSGIEDIATISTGDVLTQGDPIRKEFENLSLFGGAVWYVDPSKTFIYKPYDDVVKRWGFSDDPNKTPISASPAAYQNATYPFREVSGTEDASYMVNDALIWGGSAFAGASGPTGGTTIFARTQNATSIANHHRWQIGETHFGDKLFSIQDQVDARANVIINGPPGADVTGQQKGQKNSQWEFTFTWFSADVPTLSGTPDHVRPGDLLSIELWAFGVFKFLPVRELRISFPDAFEADGTHLVQFTGTFGLQLSDPFTLWRFLKQLRGQAITTQQQITVVTDSSTSTIYGATYIGSLAPATDGSTTVFTIPFGYATGSTELALNGVPQVLGTDYTESDPAGGEITMTTAPSGASELRIVCTTLAA